MSAAWEYFTTQKQWRLYLQDLVRTNYPALLQSIVLIYNNQTDEEKHSKESTDENNIGFTKKDAKEMSEIAEKILRGEKLTAGEMAKSKNKMTKYWRQLMEISLEKLEQKRQMTEEQKDLAELNKEKIREEKRKAEAKKQFELSIQTMRRCANKGVCCDYGICDECPVTQGFRLNMNFLKEL